MKNLVSIILVAVCSTAYAQTNLTTDRIEYNEKSGSIWIKPAKDQSVSAHSLATDKARLELPEQTELHLSTQKTDSDEFTHYKYAQHHAGVRVEGGGLIIHEKSGNVTSATGKLLKGLTDKKRTMLSEEQALQKALGSFGAARFLWEVPASELPPQMARQQDMPKGELVWLPTEIWNVERTCMAYKFDVFSIEPMERKWVYVNVETGNIELAINQIQAHNCFAEATCNHTESNNITTTFEQDEDNVIAESNYVGAVQIDTDPDTLRTQIDNTRIQVFDGNNQDGFVFNAFTSSDNTWSDPTAIDVHWGMERTYAYYKEIHGRNSYDGNDGRIVALAHYGSNFPNAFWNGSWMTFGDGNGDYSSLTSLDIVAHEFTHAVTEHTSSLNYYGESGALNESFSDIFGEMVEYIYHPNGNDWIVAAEVVQISGKNGIRSLSNPKDPQMTTQQPNTYLGENWYEDIYAINSVHINSGVQNYWFYLLANGGQGINDHNFAYDMEGIDVEDAARIAYQTLANYLDSGADYEDARIASILAAEDLFGVNSIEAQRTAEAWCAVGVGNQCTSDVSCAVRDSLVLLELYDGWNPQAPMDTWSGIVLNENRCVTSVALHGVTNGTDELPVSLCLLSELKFLHLVGCDLTGYIPPEFGQLSQLEKLYLGGNALTGKLPVELANLTNLKQLSCPNNELSGTLPPEYGQLTNLTEMSFDGNNFSGALPAEWGSLTDLLYLTLSENNLSGTLPVEWSNLDTLTVLQAEDNFLSGEIPQEYTQLNHLFSLILHNNQFYGTLPDFSGVALSVYDNRFTFAGLEGNLTSNPLYAPQSTIPLLRNGNELSVDAGGDLADNIYEWYKDDNLFATITADNTLIVDTPGMYRCAVSNAVLTNPNSPLTNLILESTELYVDPRPCALRDSLILVDLYHATGASDSLQWDFTQPMNTWNGVITNTEGCVRYLVLNDKGLSGILPESLYNLSELERLFLYRNPGLNGNIIPPEIGNLTELEMYSIAGCGFTDTIPDELGQLTDLWHLGLGNNNFSGTFPTTLLQLTNLEYLHMPQNSFTGTLPEGLGNLTQLEYFSLHNNYFKDTIPESLADLPNLSKLYIYSNNFISPLPTFPNDMAVLNIRENGFNFDDVMNNIHLLDNDFIYEDQDRLPIYSNGNALYVNAGGNLADNTYIWYEDGNDTPIDTIVGDKEYTPAVSGEYYCKVTNALLTNNILKEQNLILTSEVYDISTQTSEPVYPGDMDNNGVVNNYDVLYWGLSNGYKGYARPDASLEWTPQPASNWLASVNGVNAKHQDADGNDTIDIADFQVISMNYGKTHTTTTPSENNGSPNNLQAEIVSRVRNGELTTLTIEISLKNQQMIPISTHGIAFDLDYQSEVPVDGIVSVEMNFGNSWLTGGDASSLKTVSNIDNDNNRLSFGITRDDRQNMIGIGQIGTAVVIICDDIHFGDTAAVSRIIVNNGGSMSANQIITPLTGIGGEYLIPPVPPLTCIDNDDHSLLVLPFNDSPNGLLGETPTQTNLTYDAGVFDQAADVDGMTFSTADNLNTSEGTLEVWVKPSWDGNDGQSHVILQAGAWGGMLMEKDGGNYLKIILNRWAAHGQPEIGTGYNVAHWQAGEWQHIAYTWGNGEILMYINGTIVASKNYTNLPPLHISEFNIGKDYWGGHNWDGLIDELRISDVVRTPQEIMDAVEACAPVPDAPITCIENDDSSLLVLPFENNPNGLSGETPIQAELAYNTGIFGQAANLSIGSSGLTFSTADNLNTSEGTLEVWVKPLWDGNDGQSHVILQAGTSGGMLMEKDGGNYLKIILNRWGGTSEIGIGYNVAHWEAGQWQHIAYTWGNQQVCMYVNGIPVDCKTNVNIPALNVGEFNIGKDYHDGHTWDGLMDELRISNIARSPQQIADAVADCSTELRYQQRLEVDIRNYPNPFAEYTTIEFELLEDNPTTIQVFDIKGSPIATVLNERKMKGKHKVVFNAENLPAGVYYYMIRSGEYFGRKNMMIIK